MSIKKLKLWDFLSFQDLSHLDDGALFIDTYSAFIEKMLLDDIKLQLNKLSQQSIMYQGSEIDENWISDKMVGLDLFSESSPIIVCESHRIKKNIFETILNMDKSSIERKMIFFSQSKAHVKLFNKHSYEVISIEPPAFWEGDKLFNTLEKKYSFSFQEAAKRELIEYAGAEISLLLPVMEKLHSWLEGSSKIVNLTTLRKVLPERKIDFFQVAQNLNEKKMAKVFQALISAKDDQIKINLCSFLISHLLKIYDPSQSQAKKKMSKYDREILSANKSWSNQEVSYYLGKLKEVMFLVRSKKFEAITELMKSSIRL